MPELFVVRHADAGDPNPARWPNDLDRQLTSEGEESSRETARALPRFAERPKRVLASPAVRAMQTAQILTEEAAWPLAAMLAELWGGSLDDGVAAALGNGASDETIAVVGHDPMLSELVGFLSGAR